MQIDCPNVFMEEMLQILFSHLIHMFSSRLMVGISGIILRTQEHKQC